RYFGMKNYERLHDAISTSLIFSFIIGITMMAVGICIADVLLNIVACPADVYDEAIIYLRVYLVGLLFTSLYNVASGVLRSVGDSRNPFIYLVISSILNIILDIIFVVVFKMQVLGVALATIISQLLSVILVYYQLTHAHDVYRIDLRHLKFDSTMLKEVISLGLPAALQSCLISISNLFGSSVMAGVGAAKKIDKFVGLIANSLGMSTATFVSQNIGAKRIDRAKKGIRITFVLAFIPVAIIGSLIYIYANRAISLFIDDKDAIYYGAMMIHTMMPLYYSQSINQIMLNTLRGFGKSFVAMILSLLGMIGIRQIFLAISFSIERNVNHVFLGYPIGWIFSALFVSLYYFIVIRPKYK
ncbi:MAG: MATE family efflux transporter, partial [Erysipelotrichaceae bacterium]|nr:MATE family efflux transporter [Erysipelotrichaceae bacterium]